MPLIPIILKDNTSIRENPRAKRDTKNLQVKG
jgi:hypothetical protein